MILFTITLRVWRVYCYLICLNLYSVWFRVDTECLLVDFGLVSLLQCLCAGVLMFLWVCMCCFRDEFAICVGDLLLSYFVCWFAWFFIAYFKLGPTLLLGL